MPTPAVSYPFDPTGSATTNLITGEQHPVQEFNYEDFYLIVPLQAPFFTTNLLVQYTDPTTPLRQLQEGVDYNLVLPYWGATRSIGLPVYGGILILNNKLTGTISLNYQTIGGIWCGNQQYVLQNLAEQMYNPRAVLWDVLTNVQQIFPPINHSLSIDNTYGLDTLNNELSALAATIANRPTVPVQFITGGSSSGGSSSGSVSLQQLNQILSQYSLTTVIQDTYQPISAMGSYLTTAQAAATYVPIGPGGTIPPQYIPANVIPPSIFGPNTLNTGSVGTYTISNYNTLTAYTVSATSGTVTILGATISYTAPSTPGTAGFEINGNTIPVTITVAGNTPTIIGPTSLLEGTSGTYTISNYDANVTYTVTPISGTITINQATITYTAPAVAGTSGFVINGVTVNVSINPPATPIISGPSTAPVNSVVEFTITNYVVGASYAVSATVGTVTINQATITYNTPATAGQGGFTVGGINVPVNIISAYIDTPSVISPVAGSTSLQLTLTATSSAFQASGMNDTQAAANWQLATDSAFTNIVLQSINSTTNLSSWVVSNLEANTTYYIRVQYIGNSGATSAWSIANQFTTKIYVTPKNILQSITSAASESTQSMQFGYSVAMDDAGVTAVVSAITGGNNPNFTDTGAIFIFKNNGGVWTETQMLTAPDPQSYPYFGKGLAISGDGNTIVVGAYNQNVGSNSSLGSGYIFTFNGTSFVFSAEVFPTGSLAVAGIHFGSSVSVNSNGTVIAFGANGCTGGSTSGIVYIFTGSGSTWTQVAVLQASDKTVNDNFGNSVALSSSGATLIVGAPFGIVNNVQSAGKAYIFQNTVNGWEQTAEILSPSVSKNSYFGNSVAINQGANVVVIGCMGAATTGNCYVYTYSTSTSSWALTATLIPSDLTMSLNFGFSVDMSLDGNTIIVGANNSTVNNNGNVGETYIFQNTVNGWEQYALFQPTVASYINIYFGNGVAIDGTGNLAISGAPGTNTSLSRQGVAYILG